MNDPGDEHSEQRAPVAPNERGAAWSSVEQPEQPQPPTLARVLMEAALCEARLAALDAKISDAQTAIANLRTERLAVTEELSALRMTMDRCGGGLDIRGLNGDPRDRPVPQKFNRTNGSWEDR